MDLVASVLEGNRLSLARLLTQIENDTPQGREALNGLFAHTGQAHLLGVTGAPGTGKSSLVNQLARYYRQPLDGSDPVRVAIVAVDPSSPFSGGAILGDRVRMRDLAGDPGVFIRSMASRGSLGGLAGATSGIVQVLDAAGYDIILIETVGAGQAEVDIARLAHTTLVVEAPGLGDDIQAIKAGILEIADVLIINKADRPGVESTERALRGMLQLAHPGPRVFRHHGQVETIAQPLSSPTTDFWEPPVLRTVATESTGIAELASAIQRHRQYLEQNGGWQQREQARLQVELDVLLREALVARWNAGLAARQYTEVLQQLVAREISPYEAVTSLLKGSSSA
jgi:LAO/AO transport system kinase